MLRFGSFCLLASLCTALVFPLKQAEDPPTKPRFNLDAPLSPVQTISSLTARLKLLTGDYDSSFLKDVTEKFKNNPNMSKDDLLSSLAKEKDSKGLNDLLSALKKDPKALESLMGLMDQGGLSGEQMQEFLKQFLNGSKLPDLSGAGLSGGAFDPGKLNIDGALPQLKTGQFELPEGSNKFLKDLVSGWEKNVGSINDNPALKNSLESLFKNGSGFQTGDIKKWLDEKGFDVSSMKGLFGKNDLKLKIDIPEGPKNVKLPDINLGSFGGSPTLPSAPNFGGWSLPGFDGFSGGGAAAAIPVLIAIGVVAALFLAWWLWPQIQASRQARQQAGKLPLPAEFDPRNVRDRPTLVQAFEMLSLVVCGNDAKVWNHATIGKALREYLNREPEGIERLAVMYALARYTPQGEELHPDSVREARRTLCRLAGVPEE